MNFEPLKLFRVFFRVHLSIGKLSLSTSTFFPFLSNSNLTTSKAPEPGGLACTDVTPEGFLYDMGGHVIFSHYRYFDELVDAGLGAAEALPSPNDEFWAKAEEGADVSLYEKGSSSISSKHWNTLQRVSYVRLKGRWVAYPFQNNIAALSDDDKVTCLTGLAEASVEAAKLAGTKPRSFDEWILRSLGKGIADLFMRPYNFKVWAHPTTEMAAGWLGERVAQPDLHRALGNAVRNTEDAGWGPNAVFRFPKRGGTGAIWRGVGSLLPKEKTRFGAGFSVVGVDVEEKKIKLSNGSEIGYECLISTLPLDSLLLMVNAGMDEKKKKTKEEEKSDSSPPPRIPPAVRTMLESPLDPTRLRRSASHIIGVGIRGECPLGLKCWLYFPEPDCPFYRATVFSNYSEKNCPPSSAKLPTLCLAGGGEGGSEEAKEGPYWSLMFEVSESDLKPVESSPESLFGGRSFPAVVADSLRGAVATGLLNEKDEVVSLYHRRLEHGYPTPSLGRDSALETALPWLKAEGRNIWSRGRFGSWKYEVGNQDHSLMLGVEAADAVLFGSAEPTLTSPDTVNSGKNEELRFAEAPRANGWR